MNTQGWIRALMAKNYGAENFLEHVVECLGKEFEMESSTIKQKGRYLVKLGIYSTLIPVTVLSKLKSRGPYNLDMFILDQLQTQGFDFDKRRSQYTRYCYNIF